MAFGVISSLQRRHRVVGIGAFLLLLGLVVPSAASARTFSAPTYSSPITLSADGRVLWVVNPGGDNVVVISTSSNRVIRRIGVVEEPQSVAVDPNNRYAFVANAADGRVTVIRITNPRPGRFRARVDRRVGRRGAVLTGAEPWNIVASPDGRKIFVGNSSQDTITVMDAVSRTVRGRRGRRRVIPPQVIGHIRLRGSACSPDGDFHFQPRGLAASRNSRKRFVRASSPSSGPGSGR
jgi:YVTN family beta-propeller protein